MKLLFITKDKQLQKWSILICYSELYNIVKNIEKIVINLFH